MKELLIKLGACDDAISSCYLMCKCIKCNEWNYYRYW
jgi:hypothetical protein